LFSKFCLEFSLRASVKNKMLHLTILKYLIVFLLVKMNSSETEINLNKSNLSEWVEYKSRAGKEINLRIIETKKYRDFNSLF